MTQECIVIDVAPTGAVRIEANGFTGNACAKATEQLEIVLGGHRANKRVDHKPEFSMPATTAQETRTTF